MKYVPHLSIIHIFKNEKKKLLTYPKIIAANAIILTHKQWKLNCCCGMLEVLVKECFVA